MSTSNVNPLSGLPVTDPLNPVGASPFATNPFPGDLLALPIPEDDPLWDLSPVSPTMGTGPVWDAKGDAAVFASSGMERDFKNTQVRNGQPTPPPYEDPSLHDPSNLGLESATKRRRVRESQLATASLSPDLDDDEPHNEQAKRAKFLERNRLAASKCRQKKKEHTQQLEYRYKEQSEKKERLVGEIARLRSEILSLKNEVLKHAQCGDEPIKLHLAQMVKRITDTDGSSVPADPPVNLVETIPASPEAAPTPTPNPIPIPMPTTSTTLSFGFDDPLQLDPSTATTADAFEQIRRESEVSMVTESSYAFSTEEEAFEQLINVT